MRLKIARQARSRLALRAWARGPRSWQSAGGASAVVPALGRCWARRRRVRPANPGEGDGRSSPEVAERPLPVNTIMLRHCPARSKSSWRGPASGNLGCPVRQRTGGAPVSEPHTCVEVPQHDKSVPLTRSPTASCGPASHSLHLTPLGRGVLWGNQAETSWPLKRVANGDRPHTCHARGSGRARGVHKDDRVISRAITYREPPPQRPHVYVGRDGLPGRCFTLVSPQFRS